MTWQGSSPSLLPWLSRHSLSPSLPPAIKPAIGDAEAKKTWSPHPPWGRGLTVLWKRHTWCETCVMADRDLGPGGSMNVEGATVWMKEEGALGQLASSPSAYVHP